MDGQPRRQDGDCSSHTGGYHYRTGRLAYAPPNPRRHHLRGYTARHHDSPLSHTRSRRGLCGRAAHAPRRLCQPGAALSALGDQAGIFDTLAKLAARWSGGSAMRLYLAVFAAGVVITAFLSNDATALILTPVVYTLVAAAASGVAVHVCQYLYRRYRFVRAAGQQPDQRARLDSFRATWRPSCATCCCPASSDRPQRRPLRPALPPPAPLAL